MSTNNLNYRKYIRVLWILFLLPLLLGFIFVWMVAAEVFGPLPTFEQLENPKSNLASEIYSSDGKVLGKYFIQNRTNIHYEDLSQNLVKALKATEDVRFEEHSGVDLKGLFRVLFKTVILRQDAGGGSTLTQQLAKNLFPREKLSKMGLVIRKVQEWVIAAKLERRYTKDEIIAMYLNTVEFGSNAYGIKSAARTFFNKTPDSLKVEEAAVLVGLLKAPTRYSPKSNPKNSLERRNVVMAQMKKYAMLTPEMYDSLKQSPIKLNFQPEDHMAGSATYFREVLRLELNAWCRSHVKHDGRPYDIYRDGLRIYTTIDSRTQRYAEEAVTEHLSQYQELFYKHWKGRVPWGPHKEILDQAMKRSERFKALKEEGLSEKEIKKIFNEPIPMTVFSWKGPVDTVISPMDSIKYYKYFLQTGFVSIDPRTGHVKAWVGGNDYRFFQYDHVKDGKRQVGSTFKPFLYTLAMQEGYSPCFKVENVPVTIVLPDGTTWTPENSDDEDDGKVMTLKQALALSVNRISAYLVKQFGPEAVINVARKMGITSPLDPVPSIVLGTSDLSVLELTGAYGTFANKGMWVEPTYMLRIEDKNGNVLQEFIPKKREAISEETAYLMINLMQGVTTWGTGGRIRWMYKFNNPIAGKTGTSQNHSDAWFIGITPDLVSGVWTGFEDRSVHFRDRHGQGAWQAMPIWAYYMKKVYADSTLKISGGDFEPPSRPISVETDCKKYKQDDGLDPWK
jgi:penicillin-binding protein 1A